MKLRLLYDLVCGRVYGYNDMAQSVGGETNFAVIGKTEWAQLVKDCGATTALLRQLASKLVKQMKAQVDPTHLACNQHSINVAIEQRLNWDLDF